MSGLLTINKIGSSPAGAIRSIASAESRDGGAETGQTNPPNAENAPVLPSDADAASHQQASPPTQQRDGLRRTGRALLKPIVALATAQYVLVTALAAFTALIVASEAGKAVSARIEPIIAALKRL